MAKLVGADIFRLQSSVAVLVGTVDPAVAGVAAVQGSFYSRLTTGEWWKKVGVADTSWAYQANGGQSNGWFGAALDGDVTMPAGTTTLTMDMYYRNLIVPAGATVVTNCWRISASERIVVEPGGAITSNGGDAVGSTAVGVGAVGTFTGSQIGGGDGGTGTSFGGSGNDGDNVNNQPPGLPAGVSQGGAGGAGATFGGGSGGTATTIAASAGSIWTYPYVICGHYSDTTSSKLVGGSGGGGGGGGPGTGGDGGGGGGVVMLIAPIIENYGAVEAHGGAGGNTATPENAGGGGGGGGGKVIGVTRQFSGNAFDVSGGAGGTGLNSGSAGAAGYALVYEDA